MKGFLSGDLRLLRLTGKAIKVPGYHLAPGHHMAPEHPLAFFGVESVLSTAVSKKADSDQRSEGRPQPESPPTMKERTTEWGIWVRLMFSHKHCDGRRFQNVPTLE